ncbi:MAG: leucyl aminopeptidase [Candidatus Nanopelagicales bacterium]
MTWTPTAKIVLSDAKPATLAVDALILALVPGRGKKVEVASAGLAPSARTRLAEGFLAVGANGRPGGMARIPAGSGIAAPIVVGIGDAAGSPEALRRSIGDAVRSLAGNRRIGIAIPLVGDDALLHVAIAAQLASYEFTSFKGGTSRPPSRTITIVVAGPVTSEQRHAVKEVTSVAIAVNLARDLVNTPPNALPPGALADAAVAAVDGLPVDADVWEVDELTEQGCGGILAVGMGSANSPRLVRMSYEPADAAAHLALVGKGITFDTGGISIKHADSMHEMKGDMGGAAAVLASIRAIAELGLPVKVTGWIPMAENMPGGGAQRPGDVITIRGGTTVEVLNTDAEGRLILADALVLAAEEFPDLIIDIATLTGAQRIALGTRTAAVMSNEDDARAAVCAAAEAAGEQMWPMPLPDDLRSSLESTTADLANIGERLGGMLTAGVFLSEFVPAAQPWVHIDIAGPAFNAKGAYGYTPTGGTGAGVRTLVQVAAEMAGATG